MTSSWNRPDGYDHLIVDEDRSHAIPTLDSGYTVPQIARLYNDGQAPDDIADHFGIANTDEVQDAIDYYDEHTAEIDALLEQEDRVADQHRYQP